MRPLRARCALLLLAQILRRKPLDIRVQESITAGAVLVLVFLSATATFDDFTVLPALFGSGPR